MKTKITLALALLATACGTAPESAPQTEAPLAAKVGDKKIVSPAQDTSEILNVADEAKLPECLETSEGRIAYLKSMKAFRLCEKGDWSPVELNLPEAKAIAGADGQDGKDGRDGKDGLNGKDGKDGLQGAQGVAGANGAQGAQGLQGVAGTNGVEGIAGKNAKPVAHYHLFFRLNWTQSVNAKLNLDVTRFENGWVHVTGTFGTYQNTIDQWFAKDTVLRKLEVFDTNNGNLVNAFDFRLSSDFRDLAKCANSYEMGQQNCTLGGNYIVDKDLGELIAP